jgi:hypothetical protein
VRVFLDSILSFIGSESLTDGEFAILPDGTVLGYNEDVYQYLRSVLQDRESVSTMLDKLKSFFEAKGVNLNSTLPRDPMSSIFIGARL